jgi:Coenzyme PQQ synthesis protein D (PqqD)
MVQPALEKSQKFRISSAVRTRMLDDELILLDLRLGEYFSLNPSGKAVWDGLERGIDLATLDAELASQWPVSPEERWQLLESMVRDFLDRGLVEKTD